MSSEATIKCDWKDCNVRAPIPCRGAGPTGWMHVMIRRVGYDLCPDHGHRLLSSLKESPPPLEVIRGGRGFEGT